MNLLRTWMLFGVLILSAGAARAERPHILWITSEDHGPQMGCYGDAYATTPNVDRLAARGMIYTRVWSCAPVCAPARTALISGMFPTSTGSEHMRSMVPMPDGTKMFPELLREAGYYCSNNAKEDYNLAKSKNVWDDSSRRAHWKNRKAGQSFFAVFNSEKSHESRIRVRPHAAVHDPGKARVPAYHPDTPEVRQDWAQYYDVVSEADADAGKVLAELEADGLAGDTIVFYFGDHGSGMPRSKRWPYNSGLHVPLVVYIPEKHKALRPPDYQTGGKSDRLVSFVDFAPTVLSLAAIQPPEWMQGRAFMGAHIAPPNDYLHGFRGRMDERLDLVRSVTDGRYVYVRNYMPHLPCAQRIEYMWQTPTTRVWERLHQEGKLNAAQSAFWNRKPAEELYDLQNDPDEVNNLEDSPAHGEIKSRLRKKQREQIVRVRDLGFIPEGERFARSKGSSPHDAVREGGAFPLTRIVEVAELASMLEPGAGEALRKALRDEDGAVRYWAVLGLLMGGKPATQEGMGELRERLRDQSADVRIAAAETVGRWGNEADREECRKLLLGQADWSKQGVFSAMAALNSLDALDGAGIASSDLAKLPASGPAPDQRYSSYVPNLLQELRRKITE